MTFRRGEKIKMGGTPFFYTRLEEDRMKIKFESRNDDGEKMRFPFVWVHSDDGIGPKYLRYKSKHDIRVGIVEGEPDIGVCNESNFADDYAWVRRWHGKIIIEA